jgi:hypothetical protein
MQDLPVFYCRLVSSFSRFSIAHSCKVSSCCCHAAWGLLIFSSQLMFYLSEVLNMRILAKCLLVAAMAVPAAFAQSAPAAPPCDGRLTIVRVSTIKPEGSMDKFMAAVTAQKAWYKSHGLGDMIFASKIVSRNADGKFTGYSTTEAISYHFYAKNTDTMPTHDADWDAFVKMFADTSTIKETYLTCVPAAMVPMPGM